jgi:hypothetical protein
LDKPGRRFAAERENRPLHPNDFGVSHFSGRQSAPSLRRK